MTATSHTKELKHHVAAKQKELEAKAGKEPGKRDLGTGLSGTEPSGHGTWPGWRKRGGRNLLGPGFPRQMTRCIRQGGPRFPGRHTHLVAPARHIYVRADRAGGLAFTLPPPPP